MQNDSGGDAAAAYVEAAKCYQKTNKTGAAGQARLLEPRPAAQADREGVRAQTWSGCCTKPLSTTRRMAGWARPPGSSECAWLQRALRSGAHTEL